MKSNHSEDIHKRLAALWKNPDYQTEFDVLLGAAPNKQNVRRRPGTDIKQWFESGRTWQGLVSEITNFIVVGVPLSYHEYHIALATRLLVCTDVSYEKFFTSHWHETKSHVGYGSPRDCTKCNKEEKQ